MLPSLVSGAIFRGNVGMIQILDFALLHVAKGLAQIQEISRYAETQRFKVFITFHCNFFQQTMGLMNTRMLKPHRV